jgi:hypothetical protein
VIVHVPLLREGETDKPTYHLINEKTLKLMTRSLENPPYESDVSNQIRQWTDSPWRRSEIRKNQNLQAALAQFAEIASGDENGVLSIFFNIALRTR